MSAAEGRAVLVSTDRDLLREGYAAFNERDIESVLAVMHPDIDWPNAMEGGRLRGHKAVREYWLRQFELIDANVDPLSFYTAEDGRIVVEVHRVVREKGGAVIADEMVEHLYRIEDGLVLSMEIRY